MFTKKELVWIIVMLIVYEFIIIFPSSNTLNPLILLVPIMILFTNIISKKIAAGFFNIKIEHKVWEFQRWGYYKRSYFKKPFQIGLILPFALSILTLGMVRMFTFFQFEVENIHETRILKQRGLKRKEEINESDIAFTAAWGFLSLLVLAIIGALPGIKEIFPELAKNAVYFGFWNMIPISKLDGSKLFFGSILTWAVLAILYLIALILVII
jgi:Zn-dependent protease